MIDAIKRTQLQRKGLSCGKKRREQNQSAFMSTLRYSPFVRYLIYAAFLGGFLVLVLGRTKEVSVFFGEPAKIVIVSLLLIVIAVIQQQVAHREHFRKNSLQCLIFGLVFLQVSLMRVLDWVVEVNGLEESFNLLLMPFALAPMTLTILLGRNQGLFAVMIGSLLGCLLVPEAKLFVFLISSLLVGLLGVYITQNARKRGRVVQAGFYSGAATVLLIILLGVLAPYKLNGLTSAQWQLVGVQVLCGIVTGIFSGMLVGGCLPFLESAFGVTTDIGWVELSDLNHPMLRRMSLEAPGTYQHSLMVAHLAEAAAEAIGANATMCRVCSYFHDLGKLNKPSYFIENASPDQNPHDDLTPTMSALVIMAHVKDGVDMAIKNGLNCEIHDVIQQHHGTSLVYFFYRKALDARDQIKQSVEEGKANQDDVPEVAEKNFRYPGPKPQFRESAIISLADSVESASRSLQKPTPQKVEQLVEEIVRSRINDGQLDECDLTLRELDVIKTSLVTTLRSIMHSRIVYPKEESAGNAKEKGKAEIIRKGDKRTKTQKLEGESSAAKPDSETAAEEAADSSKKSKNNKAGAIGTAA
ncbi:MAG: HDIG domain-containing protein [Verrucomicrobiae bacterium]|nr:HDIG domain-containing protein [Verrucomicrobiae bacterium]